ncbi:hypothetical protein ABFS82_02G091600 [Erythranthe guttata]
MIEYLYTVFQENYLQNILILRSFSHRFTFIHTHISMFKVELLRSFLFFSHSSKKLQRSFSFLMLLFFLFEKRLQLALFFFFIFSTQSCSGVIAAFLFSFFVGKKF